MEIFINGKKVLREAAAIPFFSEHHLAVFEGIKSYGGTAFRLDEHLTRLFESAKTVGLKLPKSRTALQKEIKSCLGGSRKDKFVRLAVDDTSSYVLVLDRKHDSQIYKRGVDLRTTATRRNLNHSAPPEAKSSAFFNSVLATIDLESHRRAGHEVFDAVFLDPNGHLVEATIWNLFGVKSQVLVTPGVGILNGVTRQFVLKCAALEDLPVSETILSRHDLWNCDEAFLTNTSGELVPIRSLDGRKIGTRIPGPVTKKLQARFHEEVERELRTRRNRKK